MKLIIMVIVGLFSLNSFAYDCHGTEPFGVLLLVLLL